MQTLLQNAFVSLYYHPDKNMVHHVYREGIGGEYLYEALNVGTDALIQTRSDRWLSDNRALQGHTDEEAEWINTVWLPRTIQAGWKYWALVIPEAEAAKMNIMAYIASFSDKGVRVQVFVDPDEAMAWLTLVGREKPMRIGDKIIELPRQRWGAKQVNQYR